MAGIYIHIPFCRSRCIYCGFYSTTSLDLCQRYVDAVIKEWALRSEKFFRTEKPDTIYLGGGTPSQLTIEQLKQIFDALNIYNRYSLDSHPEITIEVNPDDVSVEFTAALHQLPINRVSMGAQTFDNTRLQWLHRRHTAQQVREAVQRLRDAGIKNISIDLMYGFPGETLADWERDIDCALSLNAEHLSAYCLSIEEGTPLWKWKRENGRWTMDEELEREMYYLLKNRLEVAGYEHYEISNFAKPGFRSRHNSSYWNGTPYLGLGAAAHSFDGHSRSWNVADIHQYIEGIELGKRCYDSETIEGDTRYNDLLTVTLRTREGLDLGLLDNRQRDYCLKHAHRFIDDGLLKHSTGDDRSANGERLSLTRRGLFVSDMIFSELMLVDD